ncbi:MAG: hypothetical protein Phog2KO_03540 [Phototrophicaceae bacterium]
MIAKQLLDTGLLQFGLFEENNVQMPYRLRLEMLPAYPELLQNVVYRAIQSLMGVAHFDRLVAHSDAIPFASAISLATSVSLVYSRGRGELPVFDLVGAYDVGHPACLIVNTLTPDTQVFLDKAQKVGLEIHTILELVSIGKTVEHIDHRAVFTMQALIHDLRQQSAIPEQMANSVLEML